MNLHLQRDKEQLLAELRVEVEGVLKRVGAETTWCPYRRQFLAGLAQELYVACSDWELGVSPHEVLIKGDALEHACDDAGMELTVAALERLLRQVSGRHT